MAFLRKVKSAGEGFAGVYIRITVDSAPTEISTRINVPKTKWNASKGRVNGNSDESKRLNLGITNFEHRIREIYHRSIEQGKIITADSLKNELLGFDHKKRLLLQQFELVVNDMEARQTAGYAKGTVKNWMVTKGHLKPLMFS